jgi:hypothetical protein
MRRCAAAKAPPRALPAAPNFRNPAENQRGIYVHYLFYVRNMFFCEFSKGSISEKINVKSTSDFYAPHS